MFWLHPSVANRWEGCSFVIRADKQGNVSHDLAPGSGICLKLENRIEWLAVRPFSSGWCPIDQGGDDRDAIDCPQLNVPGLIRDRGLLQVLDCGSIEEKGRHGAG